MVDGCKEQNAQNLFKVINNLRLLLSLNYDANWATGWKMLRLFLSSITY